MLSWWLFWAEDCGFGAEMRVFGITQTGLLSLAAGVAALWSCFAAEAVTNRQARNDLRASLQQIERLKRTAEPVSRPSPGAPAHPTAV